MIELHDVTVIYGGERTALSRVSLRIEKGEFVSIIGPTGAGKSTFLRLLYHEEAPVSGRVAVAGVHLAAMRARDVPALRRRMGVVFQDYGLLPDRTVFENVGFALRVIGAGWRDVRRKVGFALDLVSLAHRCDAFPHQLSGGEQQRVAIARALVNDPPLLLADEPTGNLDPETSLGIAEILRHVNVRGTTVVVATHDELIVDFMRRRVVEFHRGRIVRDECPGTYRAVPA
ncbi:MAG: cell division ATP-binding protein FtsE [Chthonomonadales bacterium]|nr:cell division ATP-binding protein FtsE [Chthonomonadales bacterium]